MWRAEFQLENALYRGQHFVPEGYEETTFKQGDDNVYLLSADRFMR